MPKLKTRKAALKRYKKTAAGNFLRRHAYKGHLLMHKSKTEIINMIDQNKVDNFIDNVVYGNDKENMMSTYCSFSFR